VKAGRQALPFASSGPGFRLRDFEAGDLDPGFQNRSLGASPVQDPAAGDLVSSSRSLANARSGQMCRASRSFSSVSVSTQEAIVMKQWRQRVLQVPFSFLVRLYILPRYLRQDWMMLNGHFPFLM
jgi:hypothetical protein